MRALISALLILTAGSRVQAQDTCVVNDTFAMNAGSTIGISFGSDVGADVVQSAIESWSTCGDYATGFPSFLANTNGDITVSVVFSDTMSSSGCGMFRGFTNGYNQIAGGTITLYGRTSMESAAPGA